MAMEQIKSTMPIAEALVLLPNPVIGHLRSMVELGKFIISSQPSFSIHILVFPPSNDAGDRETSSYIENVASTIPSIHFHHLPVVPLHSNKPPENPETPSFEVIHLSHPNVRQTLISISETFIINALVLDFFCASYLTVASSLKIPCYFFFTSSAACVALLLYTSTIHKKYTKSFKDLQGTFLDVPGVPPIPATDMPKPVLDRNNKGYELFLEISHFLSKSSGIIINSFELLEPRPVKAISEGQCIPNGETPPIFCIGPLIATCDKKDSTIIDVDNVENSQPEWFSWLDSQPGQSVVFLCFGSVGLFSKEQLMEIAIGLERSGQRFLWVVRNPPNSAVSAKEDPDLDFLLPEGFLNRTKERGYVVKSWIPQVDVLNHKSIGGFVTHCGWNSVLEAIWAGVPMVAWPLYAEQRFNRIMMVQDMKIALSMDDSENEFVTAFEVEKKVTDLMNFDSGKLVREQTHAMRVAANEALGEGGSSCVAMSKLIESWKRG